MKSVVNYLKEYFAGLDKRILCLATIFIALAIFINYHFGLNSHILKLDEKWQYISWYFVFLIAFSFTYLLYEVFSRHSIFNRPGFFFLVLLAPAIFSWKMVFDV